MNAKLFVTFVAALLSLISGSALASSPLGVTIHGVWQAPENRHVTEVVVTMTNTSGQEMLLTGALIVDGEGRMHPSLTSEQQIVGVAPSGDMVNGGAGIAGTIGTVGQIPGAFLFGALAGAIAQIGIQGRHSGRVAALTQRGMHVSVLAPGGYVARKSIFFPRWGTRMAIRYSRIGGGAEQLVYVPLPTSIPAAPRQSTPTPIVPATAYTDESRDESWDN
jgi:hypothetical protein